MHPKKNLLDIHLLQPILIALYPLLLLWSTNVSQIEPYAITRAALVTLIVLVLAILISLVIFRSLPKATLFASLALFLFLTYGHFFALVDARTIGGFMYGRHRFIIPLWVGLLCLGGVLIGRQKTIPGSLVRIVNAMVIFLCAFSLAQILLFTFRTPANPRKAAEEPSAVMRDGIVQGAGGGGAAGGGSTTPDVYYIILDGYSSEDVMRSLGGPDISPFLAELEQMGFYVASCSSANYDYTPVSLSSSLNMEYLDTLNVPMPKGEPDYKYEDFEALLRNSKARQEFTRQGYQFVTFKTVYNWLDIPDSDLYVDLQQSASIYNRLETVNFQYLFLSTTMLRPLIEVGTSTPRILDRLPLPVIQLFFPRADMLSSREYRQYEQNRYALQKLSELPALPGKKFVYAHLFITHQPYVFNPDGSFRWPSLDNNQAYYAQIEYINSVLPGILRKIIQDSPAPPVIIVQSDHGYPYTPDRARILNAYYLPGGGGKDLYDTISPVNSFRYVLDHYFGANYPLLPDRSFHSPHDWVYRMEPVETGCGE